MRIVNCRACRLEKAGAKPKKETIHTCEERKCPIQNEWQPCSKFTVSEAEFVMDHPEGGEWYDCLICKKRVLYNFENF